MSRYVTKADSWYAEYHTGFTPPSIQVQEQDRSPVDTGLLNHRGEKIYRMPDAVPFGFVQGKS